MIEGLPSRSVTELAALLRARHISSAELVTACLERIAEVNPRLKAVVRLADDAEEHARAADTALAAGRIAGPLHGVPFTIKDSFDTAGLVTAAGTVG